MGKLCTLGVGMVDTLTCLCSLMFVKQCVCDNLNSLFRLCMQIIWLGYIFSLPRWSLTVVEDMADMTQIVKIHSQKD